MTDLQTYGHPALQALNATFSKEQAETLLALLSAVGGIDWDSLAGKPASFPPSAHTHTIPDVGGLEAALNGKATTSHTHTIGNVTGLQSALDGKAAVSHSHSIAQITGLQDELDGKAASTHGHAIADISGLAGSLSDIEARLEALENVD
nr:MAG TPA_asm: minor tail protein [Caudoviricetes sp.]